MTTTKTAVIASIAVVFFVTALFAASTLAPSSTRFFRGTSLGASSDCKLEQAHITMGNEFATSNPGDSMWTVSAVSRDDCAGVEVTLQLDTGAKIKPSNVNSYNNAEKNYNAKAFFFQVPANVAARSWTLRSPSSTIGPINFPSTNPQRAFAPSKWAFIADMDESTFSAPTLNRLRTLKDYNLDGVFHNGDFAYNIHNSKGKVGDKYFDSFSSISKYMPYIVTPGNHEHFDGFKMFNYRFQMPGAGNGMDKQASNYFSFVYKGVYYLSVNWDYIFEDGNNRMPTLLAWMKKNLEEMSKLQEVKYRVFFTHKPFYCTMAEADCVNFYLYKPVESLLYKYKFDLILTSHVHLYYRHKKLTSLMQLDSKGTSDAPLMLISGHQGIDPDNGGNKDTVTKKRQGRMENVALAGDPNLLLIDIQENQIKVTLVDSAKYTTLDEVTVQRKR